MADPASGRLVTAATPFYKYSICKAATAGVLRRSAVTAG
jgi:hypothetical protein